VSVSSTGEQANAQCWPPTPSLSADGRFVAFTSDATNLVLGDTNGASDVFVRDRQTGTTERASVDSTGGQANAPSWSPFLSSDGRFVAFESGATDLVPGDPNGGIFIHDRQTGVTERVSVDQNSIGSYCAISADGRFVTFCPLRRTLSLAIRTTPMMSSFATGRPASPNE